MTVGVLSIIFPNAMVPKISAFTKAERVFTQNMNGYNDISELQNGFLGNLTKEILKEIII